MKNLEVIFRKVVENPVLEEEFATAFPEKYRPNGSTNSLCPWHKGRKPTLKFINGTTAACSKCKSKRTFDRIDLHMLINGKDFYNSLLDLAADDGLATEEIINRKVLPPGLHRLDSYLHRRDLQAVSETRKVLAENNVVTQSGQAA